MTDRYKIEGNTFTLDDSESGLSGIVDDISSEVPQIQEHVIEAHNAEQASGPVDNDGSPFDPNTHATGADGNGVKTAKGMWRKKRAGKSAAPKSVIGTPGTGTVTETKEKIAARASGIALAQMTIMLGVIVGGEEWNAKKAEDNGGLDETVMLTDSYIAYCEAKQISDIPPGVMLSFALIAYAGPRFAMPKTQSRLLKLKEWIGIRYINWKAKRAARKSAKLDAR